MQSFPLKYEPPVPSETQPAKHRRHKSVAEQLDELLTSVRFWGGLSALAVLISIALPWWGITVEPYTGGSSWGLFFSPQPPQNSIDFSLNAVNAAFVGSFAIMTVLVVLSGLSTFIGTILKKALILKISLALSVITVLSFLLDVIMAVSGSCDHLFLLTGMSCISGLFGQGTTGSDIVTWGFQAGFYTFIASTILLIATLALHTSKARYS